MTDTALLLSDAHLSGRAGTKTAMALERVLAQHPGAELILVGDILDLSLFPATTEPAESASRSLSTHASLLATLQAHVLAGGRINWIPGNHDAGVESPAAINELRRLLACPDERQLQVSPWFLRRGSVHIEHGHLYDRDCAPNHPLADHDGRSEGLGTALMRRFVAPNDALIFAHAHTTTPLSGLATAFAKWGPRAPLVIVNYFRTAFALCAETRTHRGRFADDASAGQARLDAHAARVGLHGEQLESLLAGVPKPTHQRLSSTFHRLYFDRIAAATALATGTALLGLRGLSVASQLPQLGTSALLLGGLGASYLAANVRSQKERYIGPVSSLQRAAELVARTTGAETVVFGHTHVEVSQPGYANLGSFGYNTNARPYTLLTSSGKLERRALGP